MERKDVYSLDPLRGTRYDVNRDYPKEITQARSKPWPLSKEHRAKNKKSTVFLGYPAKLIVKKQVIQDEFPDWNDINQLSIVSKRSQEAVNGDKYKNKPRQKHNEIQTENRFSAIMELGDDDIESGDTSSEFSENELDLYSQEMKNLEVRSEKLTANSGRDYTPLNLSKKKQMMTIARPKYWRRNEPQCQSL